MTQVNVVYSLVRGALWVDIMYSIIYLTGYIRMDIVNVLLPYQNCVIKGQILYLIATFCQIYAGKHPLQLCLRLRFKPDVHAYTKYKPCLNCYILIQRDIMLLKSRISHLLYQNLTTHMLVAFYKYCLFVFVCAVIHNFTIDDVISV